MSSSLELFPDDREVGDRDCWATPARLVRDLEQQLGRPFVLDVCAFSWSAKAPRFYTPEINGLAQDWDADTRGQLWWCNPPFSDPAPWAHKAAHCKSSGVMILPSHCLGHGWFHDWVIPFATIHFLRGRVAYQPPPGIRPSSPAFSSFLALYRLVMP